MLTRRKFAGALSAVSAMLPLRAVAAPRARVRLEDVWLGHGPLLAHRLTPGAALSVVWRRDRACVLFEDRFIGLLPRGNAAMAARALTVAAVGHDDAGRCWIEVAS